ncbi:Predicted arabinose efflux permease, MFS family [Paracidovorax wautersii]|uniref:Predicted arabinose efflux permease, MFS family n=2 Tax=Paracidovorax wautersii TaxID=1177982 RepID=A0A1I2G9I5_9BURK|nr:Predicted arabinose efflux permease, MFS family [Paracidovorax wautersii]
MMSTRPNASIHASQVVAALAIGTIAVLMVGLQPIVLGELVDARRVSLEGVGLVAMAEIIMLGLGVVLGDALLPIARLRAVTLVAALAAAGLDLLTLQAQGDAALTAVRAAAGLAEGVLIWVATGVVVRTASPARVGGIFFVLQTLAQALLGAVLANAVIPRWGWAGSFVALGLLALLACALAFAQPARLAPLPPPSATGFRWSARTLQPLAVVFLQLAALGSFWAYLEPLGKAAGFDARGAQTLVAASLAMQVIGGIVATLAVRRLPVVPALLGCSVALAGVTGFIHQLPAGSLQGFAVACALFGFVWLFMLPFHIGLALRADPSGRLAGLVPAAQLLGSACGPLTASFIVQGENAGAVPLLSAGFAGAAALLALALARKAARPSPGAPGRAHSARPH